MGADWRIFVECSVVNGEKSVSVLEMNSTCKLIFCSKPYCSLNFAVGYCKCRDKDGDIKTMNVNIVDTNEGKFRVNSEGCWTFREARGHKWMVEKRNDPQGSEVELVDLGVLNKENGFERTLTDGVCQIFPRIQLVKSQVIKKRQASVQLMRIHTPSDNPM